MENFLNNILSSIGLNDVLDILIVAFLVYKVLGFIRETRAEQLAKGIVVLVGATLLSNFFDLYTLHWLLSGVMTVGLVALVVIFQPELRRALEHLGRSRFVNIMNDIDKEDAKRMVTEMVNAVETMSASRTGALMVIEKEITLNDIVETGTVIDARISAEMIGNVFYEGAPLHDGAMIIRGSRLYAAGCVLPLTQNKELSKELGTRHRAGIGITENSDALVIIVSEETGVISMAQNGVLTRFMDGKSIEKILLDMYLQEDNKGFLTDKLSKVFRGEKDVRK
ncbi:MAG: diadenylate cyclase CdaA [Candidatus Fimisoma sp.]|nr:diadenylate cyclase CdaA [Bacillota bacterium]MDD7285564.1 diadenylate cyclase CdaA [Bacillota bacterium]MDY4747328.1 diadenylate cyclase CdaA [Candidatus Fimisoma sp.]